MVYKPFASGATFIWSPVEPWADMAVWRPRGWTSQRFPSRRTP